MLLFQTRLFCLLALAVSLVAASAETRAAEIRVLTSGAFKAALLASAPAIERATRHIMDVRNDTAGGVVRRAAGGESFDLVIAPPSGLAELDTAGIVVKGTARPLARTGVGVGVREGAPLPDIATVESFRATLLAAPSVAYLDPKAGGSSGIYVAGLLERLGIAEAVNKKAVLVPGGLAAERVVSGEASLVLHQISEILAVKGARLVGPLPAAIQNYTVYGAAIGAASPRQEAAQAVLSALLGGDVAGTLQGLGMEAAGRF